MARQDPLTNYRFRVEIDGIPAAAFSEVFIELLELVNEGIERVS